MVENKGINSLFSKSETRGKNTETRRFFISVVHSVRFSFYFSFHRYKLDDVIDYFNNGNVVDAASFERILFLNTDMKIFGRHDWFDLSKLVTCWTFYVNTQILIKCATFKLNVYKRMYVTM